MPRDFQEIKTVTPAVTASKVYCIRAEVFMPIYRDTVATVDAVDAVLATYDTDGNILTEATPATPAVVGHAFGDPILDERSRHVYFDYVADDNRTYTASRMPLADLAAGEGVSVQTAHDAIKALTYSATALAYAGLPTSGEIV